METRNVETYRYDYHAIVKEMQKRMKELYALNANSRWYVMKDFAVPALSMETVDGVAVGDKTAFVNMPVTYEQPGHNAIATFDRARVCYHCDATDGVSGVVPLCRKCR